MEKGAQVEILAVRIGMLHGYKPHHEWKWAGCGDRMGHGQKEAEGVF